MKFTSGHFVFILIVGALGWWGYSSWSDHQAKVETETQLRLKQDFAATALNRAVTRHNAIQDWAKDAPVRFSLDLYRVMVNPEGRPIVVEGTVRDIVREGDRYALSILVRQPAAVEFVLECDAETANRLATRLPANNACTVVARISTVEKAARNFSGASAGGVEAGDSFLARGRCLAWVNREP